MAWKYIKFIKLKQDSKKKLHQDKVKTVAQHNIHFGRFIMESESNCNIYIHTKNHDNNAFTTNMNYLPHYQT